MADEEPVEEVKMSESAALELETEVAEDELVEDPPEAEDELVEEAPEAEEEMVEDPPEGAEADAELKASEDDPDYFGLETKAEDAQEDVQEDKEETAVQEETAAAGEGEATAVDATEDPDDPMKKPPHSSEVFLGGIPRSLTDDELQEVCKPLGEVYEIRLLKDSVSAGQNRGYAFVSFTNKADASKAIDSLNNAEVKGKKVRATLSQSKHRLFVGNLPKDLTKEQLVEEIKKIEPGVEEVDLPVEPGSSTRCRGFAFMEFYNTAVAERARLALSKPTYKFRDRALTVSWAEPRNEPSAPSAAQTAAAAQVKAVYVKGVGESMTETVLKEIFEKHGEIEKIVSPAPKGGQSKRDFCFVHFKERSAALAVAEMKKMEHEGTTLELCMAKPQEDRRQQEDQRPARGHKGAGRGTTGAVRGGGGGGSGGKGRAEYDEGYGGGYGAGYGEAPRGHMGMQGMMGGGYMGGGGFAMPAGNMVQGGGGGSFPMTMVPMLLPNGQVGYVLQQGPAGGGGSTVAGAGGGGGGGGGGGREGRNMGGRGMPDRRSGGRGSRGDRNDRRYRPY